MFDKLEKFLVPLWGCLWIVSLTGLSVGAAIWSVKWVLRLVGVL